MMTELFDLFVQLDIALRQEVGPMTYDNPLQKSVRKLAEACGIDWREVGEHTFSIIGLQEKETEERCKRYWDMVYKLCELEIDTDKMDKAREEYIRRAGAKG